VPHSGHPFLFIIKPPIIGEHSLQKIRLHLGHLNPFGMDNLYTVFPHLLHLVSVIYSIQVTDIYLTIILIIFKKKKLKGFLLPLEWWSN